MSTDATPPSVRARLLKIQALAVSGIAGEKENAQRLLAALCAEHGVDPESLVANVKKRVRFPVVDSRDWEIFKQCAFFVLETKRITFWKPRKAVELELTISEAIDLRGCFNHYRKLYAEEEETFYNAFIHRHNLFGPSDPDAKPPALDLKKLEQMMKMMRAMNGESWKRPVATLTE